MLKTAKYTHATSDEDHKTNDMICKVTEMYLMIFDKIIVSSKENVKLHTVFPASHLSLHPILCLS